MAFPSVDPEAVGATGLAWLLITYGYVLFQASNLISGGSDLLLLVPSMAGLVGGVVLPLLGAVPDGAIMLFSGMGPIEEAQEKLAVGVGALAGSTIMLLTIAWSTCLFAGLVDYTNGAPDYLKKPKLGNKKSFMESLTTSGIGVSPKVNHSAKVMMITTVSYLIIQVPAEIFNGRTHEQISKLEKAWAISAFVVCLIGFVTYMYLQFQESNDGEDLDKEILAMQKQISQRKISIRACIYDWFKTVDRTHSISTRDANGNYMSITAQLDSSASRVLRALLKTPFDKHDVNKDKFLDQGEIQTIFVELGERDSNKFTKQMFEKYDLNQDGKFSFEEFVEAAYNMYREDFQQHLQRSVRIEVNDNDNDNEEVENEEEEEEIPEDLLDLEPEEQQKIIKTRAFMMLFIGTALVVLFSDPLVDVLKEMSNRVNIPSFYVSFIFVPFASNASELIASRYYAMKKTQKTINVSLAALTGAASMNNTFCLAIFMAIIIFRKGLAWQYTAETASIMLVQICVGILALKNKMSYLDGVIILALYPFSIAFVAILENVVGLD